MDEAPAGSPELSCRKNLKVEILTHTLFFLFTTDWPRRPAPDIRYRGGPFLTSTPCYPNLEDLSNIRLICTFSSLQLHVGARLFHRFLLYNSRKNYKQIKSEGKEWWLERINRDILLSTSKLEEQSWNNSSSCSTWRDPCCLWYSDSEHTICGDVFTACHSCSESYSPCARWCRPPHPPTCQIHGWVEQTGFTWLTFLNSTLPLPVILS